MLKNAVFFFGARPTFCFSFTADFILRKTVKTESFVYLHIENFAYYSRLQNMYLGIYIYRLYYREMKSFQPQACLRARVCSSRHYIIQTMKLNFNKVNKYILLSKFKRLLFLLLIKSQFIVTILMKRKCMTISERRKGVFSFHQERRRTNNKKFSFNNGTHNFQT